MKPLRSFGRPEPWKIGNVSIIACMILSLCMLSLIKARYGSSPCGKSQESLKLMVPTQKNLEMIPDENGQPTLPEEEDDEENSTVVGMAKPICYETSKRSETCEAEGDIRVHGSSRTVFIHPTSMKQERKMKPYARKNDPVAIANVKEWSLKPLSSRQPPPGCTKNHSIPAMIFSIGGFTGNHFHDFTDVFVPLFISSYQFHGEVQFLISDFRSWWVNKFILIFRQLSNYEIINMDSDQESVRCFPRVIMGPSFHKVLGVDSSRSPAGCSIVDFKAAMRKAFGLERATVTPPEDVEWDMRRWRPRLLIISRKNTRKFMNERGMVDMATSLGFDVRIGQPDMSTEVSKFARLVNSADVMLGVHGAGLTNMVFLPAGAVVIQVVPMGGLDWLCRETFEDPAEELQLKYLEYRIQADESTLVEQYPKDHPVLANPFKIRKQGWDTLKSVYLDNQNVRPHLGRLRNTLMEALKHLPHKHIN
ncbi:alpha-1,3-arabinosyltransferase XAT3-like [Phoenix dactylifera]|uniref:Alpha-1,3-arabinosyltransferase XAT3-like n=1 Tax=Phoenix dactylifera TaxID=42345 RepID=A0A8B7CTV0_PHODC|nr:alpha-1,3-arabinosyltransferase XAT3-like [Phoenix dactylifera]